MFSSKAFRDLVEVKNHCSIGLWVCLREAEYLSTLLRPMLATCNSPGWRNSRCDLITLVSNGNTAGELFHRRNSNFKTREIAGNLHSRTRGREKDCFLCRWRRRGCVKRAPNPPQPIMGKNPATENTMETKHATFSFTNVMHGWQASSPFIAVNDHPLSFFPLEHDGR